MKRFVLALSVGLAIQALVWFVLPGRLGSCGPTDAAGVLKLMLLMPGMVVADWLHIRNPALDLAVGLSLPVLVYTAVVWLSVTAISRLRRQRTKGGSVKPATGGDIG